MSEPFVKAFKDLTGTDHSPFPWQERLYQRFVDNDLPGCLDIPTGLGKTSVMALWFLARKKMPALPTRLVYVVNRRTIVDQASEIARSFQDRLGENELGVSTLRGALADNREWMRYPHRS